jgi:hypothetical protein
VQQQQTEAAAAESEKSDIDKSEKICYNSNLTITKSFFIDAFGGV